MHKQSHPRGTALRLHLLSTKVYLRLTECLILCLYLRSRKGLQTNSPVVAGMVRSWHIIYFTCPNGRFEDCVSIIYDPRHMLLARSPRSRPVGLVKRGITFSSTHGFRGLTANWNFKVPTRRSDECRRKMGPAVGIPSTQDYELMISMRKRSS